MADRHEVTTAHLLRLATVDKRSLFRNATALVDTEDGIMQVPWHVVIAALEGRSKLRRCALLYMRDTFADDGIIAGATPKTADGSDLAARLAGIAAGLNAALAGGTEREA